MNNLNLNLNRVALVGCLADEPQLKTTSTGKAWARMRLATDYSWKDPQGDWKTGSEFHTVVAWDRVAQQAVKEHVKGSRIFVEGRLRSRTWTHTDGTKRYATEVVAQQVLAMTSERAKQAVEEIVASKQSAKQVQEVAV